MKTCRHRLQLLWKHPLAEKAKLINWTNSGGNSGSGHPTLSDKKVQSCAVSPKSTSQLNKERKQFRISWMTMSAKTRNTTCRVDKDKKVLIPKKMKAQQSKAEKGKFVSGTSSLLCSWMPISNNPITLNHSVIPTKSNHLVQRRHGKDRTQSICNYRRWRWTFQLSNLIKTNAKLLAYIFDYNSSWKDERTQPGSDHWKSMHHFGQCTTVLLSTKHFCGVLLYTKYFCILNILALHWNTQEENSCALQRGRSIGGRGSSPDWEVALQAEQSQDPLSVHRHGHLEAFWLTVKSQITFVMEVLM